MLEAIQSGRRVLGTIMLNPQPWADDIKRLPQVNLVEVTRTNYYRVLADIKHWIKALEEFNNLQKKLYSGETKQEEKEDQAKVSPSMSYLRDAVGGRPIISYPSHPYGFRIGIIRGWQAKWYDE